MINVDFPWPKSAEKIYYLTISHEKDTFNPTLSIKGQ